jgi:hypothetical protein
MWPTGSIAMALKLELASEKHPIAMAVNSAKISIVSYTDAASTAWTVLMADERQERAVRYPARAQPLHDLRMKTDPTAIAPAVAANTAGKTSGALNTSEEHLLDRVDVPDQRPVHHRRRQRVAQRLAVGRHLARRRTRSRVG